MATAEYMVGRKQYRRPQAIMFSDSPGEVIDGVIAPTGTINDMFIPDPLAVEFEDFLILSDHNRKSVNLSAERIEQRKRMINGRMRSVHIADKLKISTSWDRLPSRAFAKEAGFGPDGKPTTTYVDGVNYESMGDYQFTADAGAGGVELKHWYDTHPGPFWVFLAYDNYRAFDSDPFNRLYQYNDRLQMYFADFSYEIEKRGANNMDLWNVNLSLEEV